MAETRTYDPSAGDPISEAIRAALGEHRPTEPGTRPQAAPEPPAPTIAPIGTYTFVKAPKPKAEPQA